MMGMPKELKSMLKRDDEGEEGSAEEKHYCFSAHQLST